MACGPPFGGRRGRVDPGGSRGFRTMKIAVVGTGYVGLVTGTCFAESGNHVTCLDIDRDKIARLNAGEIPIYEPGLSELVEHNTEAKRLHFTTDAAAAIRPAKLVFLAVGTPSAADGSADLSSLWRVIDGIAELLSEDAIVVTKSTVPVGTNWEIGQRLKQRTGRVCDVASNPEFLKEGAAIDDFMKPDRVVVAARGRKWPRCCASCMPPSCGPKSRFSSCRPRAPK